MVVIHPLPKLHERDINRPDSLRDTLKGENRVPKGTHKVAAAAAYLGMLLCNRYDHAWTKGERGMYRRLLASAKNPVCPTCSKPMSNRMIENDGMRRSWFCSECQNL